MRKKRIGAWIGGGVAVLVAIVIIAAFLFQEPLRRYMENSMNENLDGYSVRLGGIAFRPISTLILYDLQIFQDAHPDPPIADIPFFRTSLHWRAILRARLVANVAIDNPSLQINLVQIREEMADEVPSDERGWQEAVRAIYPFRINFLTIRDGDLLYIDEDPDRPLRLDGFFFEAGNIRNIDSPDTSYPSPFRLETFIFDEGRVIIEGNADFLQQPRPGVDARLEIYSIPIDPLRPILSRYNFFVRGGEFSASGRIEHSPDKKLYEFDLVEIHDLHLDYRYPGLATEEQEREKAEAAGEALTTEEDGEEELVFLIREMHVTGNIGMVHTEADPQYRIFLDSFDLRINQLSNDLHLGETSAQLSGKFMGSGETRANTTIRPEKTGPDFMIGLKIEETHMPAMNDLLMAYGGFDVTEGKFSLIMEINVENQEIDGYVKPFFKEMTVLDMDQDKDFLQHLYEGVIGALSTLLENVPRDEVATRGDIEGDLDDPDISTWQIVGNLIRNAFFDAIIPQLEGETEEPPD